jgi:hypothetical protein
VIGDCPRSGVHREPGYPESVVLEKFPGRRIEKGLAFC